MLLIPLKQFICDHCKKIINSPEEGYVEWWPNDKSDLPENFKIVHNKFCHNEPVFYSEALTEFLNKRNDIEELLNIPKFEGRERLRLGLYVKDVQEYTEFTRRLTIPYYEQARTFWEDAIKDEFFGIMDYKYDPIKLKDLINKYSNENSINKSIKAL